MEIVDAITIMNTGIGCTWTRRLIERQQKDKLSKIVPELVNGLERGYNTVVCKSH